jgi:hypothetical protein
VRAPQPAQVSAERLTVLEDNVWALMDLCTTILAKLEQKGPNES